MHPSVSTTARAIAAAVLIAATAQPAFAACTRLGFSVNDYGKDGPTKDAKGLLDKYIAKWAADHGVAKYRTGTKEVKCELFLNLIVFDEHTCRAEATVCWEGAPVTPAIKAEGTPSPATGAKAPVVKRAAVTAPAKPAAVAATPAAAPAAKPIETGTLPNVTKPSTAAPAAPAAPKTVATYPTNDSAVAAAQKAAAAAERAAAAAERAAAAAQAAERASLPATAASKP